MVDAGPVVAVITLLLSALAYVMLWASDRMRSPVALVMQQLILEGLYRTYMKVPSQFKASIA